MRLTVVIGFVLAMGTHAWAGLTCDDYPDAIFCEDFDSYCKDPGPYTPCPSGIANNHSGPKLNYIWPRTSLNYHVTPMIECGATFDIEDVQSILVSPPYGGRVNDMGDEGGELGQATRSLIDPIILDVVGGQIHKGLGIKGKWGNAYDRFMGTDALPITISFTMSNGIMSASGLDLSDGFVELALEETEAKKAAYLDPEVAPADYIMVGAPETADCLSCRAQCAAALAARGMTDDGRAPHAPWPSVCQSYEARTASALCPDPADPTGPLIPCSPPYCPETPIDKIHKTLAIGAFAMLDPNPCHCENPPKPTPTGCTLPDYYQHGMRVPHLAFFDGWKWRALSSKIFDPVNGIPGVTGNGDFLLGDKYDWVTITIKTNTVDITHSSRQWIQYAGDICTPDKQANDTVSAITITNPGSGYVTAPTVTIAPPASGRQATATASITNGAVDTIIITDPGKGYSSVPTVTFSFPPAGTQATGTATLGGGAHYEPPLKQWTVSTANNIPRKYLGAFNALRIGNPSSCELCTQELRAQGIEGCDAAHWDGVSYQCTEWAGTKCHRMGGRACSGTPVYIDDGSNYVSFDNLLVQGGTPDASVGACCRNDGTCEVLSMAACAAVNGNFRGSNMPCDASTCLGACCLPMRACTDGKLVNECSGRFKGPGTTCAQGCPCPRPFADIDEDGDVDQLDFGMFQACFTGIDGNIKPGCECFNRNGDQYIDNQDFGFFDNCWTGPTVKWNSTIAPNCIPN